jgi:hypothetical protein
LAQLRALANQRQLCVGPASQSDEKLSGLQVSSGSLYISERRSGYSSSILIAEDFVTGDRKEQANRRASLIALGVVVALFVLGWFLTRELYSNQKIEDCVLSGRTNCVPIEAPSSY